MVDDRTRTLLNATCRWYVAATSSKTGGFLNFIESYIVPSPNPPISQSPPTILRIAVRLCGTLPRSNPMSTGHRITSLHSADLWVFAEQKPNPSKCRCPVACCCHQFKNWWLPLFCPKGQNANRVLYRPSGIVGEFVRTANGRPYKRNSIRRVSGCVLCT